MILALLLAAACVPSPAFTPTPVVVWDQAGPTTELWGYELAYSLPGGTPQKLVDLKCEWSDIDGDGVDETRFCRGWNAPLPVQRYCSSCQPFQLYDFYVRGIRLNGTRTTYDGPEAVCFSPIWTSGPYS